MFKLTFSILIFMFMFLKNIVYALTILFSTILYSQNNSVVSIKSTGSGETLEKATLNALRSSVEQAFGSFISSNTEILNDEILSDEIVSISNGNIASYDLLNQTFIEGVGFLVTLKVDVSLIELTNFAESNGVEVEFKGGLFGAKIKLQKLNEKSESVAMQNLLLSSYEILDKSFNYSLNFSDPISIPGKDMFNITFEVLVSPNGVFNDFFKYFETTVSAISLSPEEVKEYRKLNKKVYTLYFGPGDDKNKNYRSPYYENPISPIYGNSYHFRNRKTFELLVSFMVTTQFFANTFKVTANNELDSPMKFSYQEIYNELLDIISSPGDFPLDDTYNRRIYYKKQQHLFNFARVPDLKSRLSPQSLHPILHYFIDNNYKTLYSILNNLSFDKSNGVGGYYFSYGYGPSIDESDGMIILSRINTPTIKFTKSFSLSQLENINNFQISKVNIKEFLENNDQYILSIN